MNVCFIGKFPPIEGGVSGQTFWLAHALAKAGDTVHVVTNAREVEAHYRMVEAPNWRSPLSEVEGRVHVHYTSDKSRLQYIPAANPFVTSLAGLATSVIKEHGCELIYSYYLEPYGVAAYLASQWTGIPYGVRNAGSDVGRLMLLGDLRPSYEEVLRRADYVCATRSVHRRMLAVGVDADVLELIPPPPLAEDYFNAEAEQCDINEILADALPHVPAQLFNGLHRRYGEKKVDTSVPSIGIYGKAGETKGTFDLLAALHELKSRGIRFNLLAMTQSHPHVMERIEKEIDRLGLEPYTWFIPFVPHWMVPKFIRACTAVCFLERSFSVAIHAPQVPREVMYCGTCLVLSREIAQKQTFAARLADRENVLLVDPTDRKNLADQLAFVIDDPQRARAIGRAGHDLTTRSRRATAGYYDAVSSAFREIEEHIRFRRTLLSAREMHDALNRLYMDESFRRLFENEPENTLRDYFLDEKEIEVLKAIEERRLEAFARSLEAKAHHKFKRFYPLTFKLVPTDIMEKLFRRYYALFPARPFATRRKESDDFGGFMIDTMDGAEGIPLPTKDIVRYEMIRNRLQFSSFADDDFAKINDGAEVGTSDDPQGGCFRRPDSIALETFDYDVLAIAKTLSEDKPLADAAARPQQVRLVFQALPATPEPKIFKVNEPTWNVLSRCDGHHSLKEIGDGLLSGIQGSAPPDWPAQLSKLTRYLIDKSLLRVAH